MAATLLLTGCGGGGDKSNHTKKTNATINYEDYVTPVVDRKVTDCISIQQINAAISYENMTETTATDSRADYYSEDGSCHLSLGLENKSRAAFDAIAADPALWTMQENLGEIAYWSVDHTELIAYQNGYSVSVYLAPSNTISMQMIMRDILSSLQ